MSYVEHFGACSLFKAAPSTPADRLFYSLRDTPQRGRLIDAHWMLFEGLSAYNIVLAVVYLIHRIPMDKNCMSEGLD